VTLRFTIHGLDSERLTKQLQDIYDSCYLKGGDVFGGTTKKLSITSRFISEDVQIPPGPLLDLLRDLVDVHALRYERPPSAKDQEAYDAFIEKHSGDRSVEIVVSNHPIRRYYDRQKKLSASWMLERFREATSSPNWGTGPETWRVENPLVRSDGPVITKKRSNAFETDIPRQSKKFKSTLDGDETLQVGSQDTTADTVEGDCSEGSVSEEELYDEEVDPELYCGDTDWED
jgi:hypothetical protein